MRRRASSRPVGSYHSSSVWMPPPVPPAPMASAGMPSESGRLASVEPMRDSVSRLRWRSTARRLTARAESGGSWPAMRLPMRRTVMRRVSRWRCPSRVRPRRASVLTHLESVERTRDSRLSSSLVEVERRSRSAGGGGGDGVDGGAAGDGAAVERGARVGGQGEVRELSECGGERDDRAGTAGVGPGVAAGAGDLDTETARAEGAVDDRGGTAAFERDGGADSIRVGRGRREEMPHAAEVALAFFADVGGEEDGHGRCVSGFGLGEVKRGGDGEQRGEAGAVVSGARAEELAVLVLAWRAVGARGEDGVEVRGEEDDAVGVVRSEGSSARALPT